MTDDTISRQAAIDVILAINDYGNSDRANALGLAEFKITTLPTAERKGHWIELKCGSASLWKCSECGELFLEDFYYCPNCGADMRGGNDG